jgi:hypothetical protein
MTMFLQLLKSIQLASPPFMSSSEITRLLTPFNEIGSDDLHKTPVFPAILRSADGFEPKINTQIEITRKKIIISLLIKLF